MKVKKSKVWIMSKYELGRVYSWGCGYKDSRRGIIPPVLGLGHNECRMSPEKVVSLDGITISKISCGWDHSLAIDKGGKILSWGSGQNGEFHFVVTLEIYIIS